MNEYMAEKIARALESIAKSLTGIESELKKQNELLEPLSGHMIYMGADITRSSDK